MTFSTEQVQRFLVRNTYLFSLLLLVVLVMINYNRQDNLFEERVLNDNLRTIMPLMILAVGQTIVILGGGVDLSVGAIVSMTNAFLASYIAAEASHAEFAMYVALGIGLAALAGAFNGLCVAYLRLQPIVTTYATSFIFSGLALYILPEPGGKLPTDILRFYRRPYDDFPVLPELVGYEGMPFGIVIIFILLMLWLLLSGTRQTQYIYAIGSKADAAYTTGVSVKGVRLGTYILSGMLAGIAGVFLTIGLGSGDPRIGDDMTLTSIVVVVLGGTRLSGGQGGITGTIIGVLILSTIDRIISFYNVPSWSQTLVRALIIVGALSAPGLISLLRTLFKQVQSANKLES